jgi:hypothetical protein
MEPGISSSEIPGIQSKPSGFQPRAFSFSELFIFESYAKISGERIVARYPLFSSARYFRE